MICTLTARRLTPGSFDAFREQFVGANETFPAEVRERWKNVYVCQDVADPDVALTFGFFHGTLDDLRELQGRIPPPAAHEEAQALIADTLFDGSFEVTEELTS
jgi:hypothetical protein